MKINKDNTAKIKIDATSPYKITPKLQKGLILDMPLAEPYTEANDTITKDRTPQGNDGTVSGATIKYDGLVNAGDGIAYINQDKAYGTWEFDVNKGTSHSFPTVGIISDNVQDLVSTNGNNYHFLFNSEERIYLRKGIFNLFKTGASYIAINTDYRIKITRSLAGVFTMYIKGGTFGWDDWTTVVADSGTNPVTDNTYTTSNYFVADLDDTDTVSNLKIDGKRISLSGAVQSTGTWTLTGDAYSFTTDDYISIADADVFSFGDSTNDSPFSVSAWVNMDDATSFMIANKGIYNTDGEWSLYIDSSDKFRLILRDESVASCQIGRKYDTVLTSYEDTWIHLVATYDGSGGVDAEDGINIYLNGVAVDDTDVKNGTYVAMENLTHDVWIGRYDTTYAEGQISNFKIFNRELSTAEIELLYDREKAGY